MGYKALVTINLPGVTGEEREIFYNVLKAESWKKIPNLDTAWEVIFEDGGTRLVSINIMKNDLRKAKEKSKINKVYYAIQVDTNDLVIDNL
jgi:hypothetical protein